MLARNAPKLDDWMTRGIVGSLKIPMAWVNEAKVGISSCPGNFESLIDTANLGHLRTQRR